MVFEKCHFEDTFKKVISKIEDIFDKEIEDGIEPSISTSDGHILREQLHKNNDEIVDNLWDKEHNKFFSKTEHERLLYQQLLILLYLYKESLEETQWN